MLVRAAADSWSGRIKIALLAFAVIAAIWIPIAAASTLAAEVFEADELVLGRDESQLVAVVCGPTPTSPFTYHIEGTATGPHPGAFVEDGTVTLGPLLTSTLGQLASLDATFSIMSAAGNVTGEKHLLASVPTDVGFCTDSQTAFLRTGQTGTMQLCYSARFSDGSTEVGRSFLLLNQEHGGVSDPEGRFVETFVPDSTVTCAANGQEKVTVCHRPPGNQGNAHTIQVGSSALSRHLGHGDTAGSCQP
jgi:hypothetical protein